MIICDTNELLSRSPVSPTMATNVICMNKSKLSILCVSRLIVLRDNYFIGIVQRLVELERG